MLSEEKRAQIEAEGFAILENVLPAQKLDEVASAISGALSEHGQATYALRNLVEIPVVRELAEGPILTAIIESILDAPPFCVKGIYFDKPQDHNWSVPWHQDLTIAVAERLEVEGFGPWSRKEGVVHVQPPAEILEKMVTVRIHLDENNSENGPLWVAPETHRQGRIKESEITGKVALTGSKECQVPRGGALIMRPLILHSSPTSRSNQPRRVVHLEYACTHLPDGLRWARSRDFSCQST